MRYSFKKPEAGPKKAEAAMPGAPAPHNKGAFPVGPAGAGHGVGNDRFASLRNAARAVKPKAAPVHSEAQTKAKRGAAALFAKGK